MHTTNGGYWIHYSGIWLTHYHRIDAISIEYYNDHKMLFSYSPLLINNYPQILPISIFDVSSIPKIRRYHIHFSIDTKCKQKFHFTDLDSKMLKLAEEV